MDYCHYSSLLFCWPHESPCSGLAIDRTFSWENNTSLQHYFSLFFPSIQKKKKKAVVIDRNLNWFHGQPINVIHSHFLPCQLVRLQIWIKGSIEQSASKHLSLCLIFDETWPYIAIEGEFPVVILEAMAGSQKSLTLVTHYPGDAHASSNNLITGRKRVWMIQRVQRDA